ncbi:coiled-coil alpha-helical rod protein 1 isoform X1 [Dasypus novemcinctus]|uniref:coiled-coil alpha-helical rod protein 1 isoform X1 n=1 Tax=Dasypus novemcinctus TaxID=9361 RepID=UPI00265E22CB|nr:coiled-coil alpha-helical rod protein 1 isoform X2 [Dasypus novemcinctus]
MWARPSAARPWASAFLAKEPGAVAWWCLEGLPRGLAEPWRELWGSGPQPPRPAPQECGTIGEPGNLRRGIMDSWRQTLEPSHTAGMFRPSGSTRLIPPSHFQARPFPPVPRLAPTWVSDSPPVQSPAHQEVPERRLDNQRLQVGMWERAAPGDGQEPARRDRSLDLQGSQALSQQAELIFRQLQELRRLEEEVRLLRETSLQQKKRLEAQALELEALAQAEKAGRAEAEGLRAALAGAELVRKNLEEGSQRELEEVRRLHQEQLSRLMEAHQEALSSLTSKAEGLEKSLSSLEARKAEDVEELAMARKEAELLQKQLSKTQEDLEAQVALVATLRNYVGEQVPPEAHSQPWELERQELLNTLQHVQEDRDALRSTAELLQVRVQSLACILALQEEDLAREAHPADPLEPECVRKVQSLLSCWREKVFALMVQLKAQDLAHQQRVGQLKAQVAGLEGRVASQSQKEAVLQRALQDKAAQVEMERMGAKALQGELSRAQEARLRQQQQAAAAEEQLRLVVDSVSSSQVWLLSTVAKVDEAASRIPSLSARLSYATRRVLTIQGLMARKVALAQLRQESCPPPSPPPPPPPPTDVSLELQQLREERNRLDAELQLSARLIQQEVGRAREQGEAERQQLSVVAQQLEQELQRAQESLASVGLQLEVARQGQQESTAEAASLRHELTQQQEIYGKGGGVGATVGRVCGPGVPQHVCPPALQEKVTEVETRLREQLSETERRLSEARREHTKAVVSLRQIQRKSAREKERNQELRHLQDEARKEEGLRLTRRLQELERDKNLMLQRLLAVLPSLLDKRTPAPSPRPLGSPPTVADSTRESKRGTRDRRGLLLPVPTLAKGRPLALGSCGPALPAAAGASSWCFSPGSLFALLDDLQGLSEAISREDGPSEAISREDGASPQGGPSGPE